VVVITPTRIGSKAAVVVVSAAVVVVSPPVVGGAVVVAVPPVQAVATKTITATRLICARVIDSPPEIDLNMRGDSGIRYASR
jgi:hypothetical protein